jgi:DNA-binding SARP family transcriptional activator/tetratricopeptide (TPR) repeat protein
VTGSRTVRTPAATTSVVAGDAAVALRVRLLGDFDVRYGAHRLPALESPRLRSLLAYLLLHQNVPQPRERLAFLLWPDSTEAQAKTNLRQLVHHLRRGLGEAGRHLECTTRTIGLRLDAPVWCDVVEFERAADHAAREGASRDDLSRAAELYTGDLLPGCYNDWLLDERDRVRRRIVEVLERLVETFDERRDYSRAVHYAELLLRRDPLHEATYRRLMRLHAVLGERAHALRAYHTCASILERELGVEPDPATRAVYESLLVARHSARHEPEAGPHTGAVTCARATLVGRDEEWEFAIETWRGSARGSPHLLAVVGEAGIGKSRLVEELAEWCAHQGVAVAKTRAYLAESRLAYAPIADWLRSEALQPGLAALDDVARAELSRLLPELSTGRPGGRPLEHLSEAERRRRLFEAAARAVVAADRALLLVLDDLQWCDRDTLEFLHYLVRASTGAQLLVAGTARVEDVGPDHPLTAVLTGLADLDRLRRLALGPLSEQNTGALAEQLHQAPLGPAVMQQLYRETEGNPLFVVETVRALSPAHEPDGDRSLSLPPKIRSAIETRLDALTPAARDLAGLAAVVGREFGPDVLAACSMLPEDLLIRCLDELWHRRIIRDHPSGGYDFSHDKIREVAYLTTGPARRRWLHLKVAQAIAAIHGDALDDVAGQIARHYDRGGAADGAIHHYRLATGAAQRLWASEQVIGLLSRALELLRTQPETPERDAAELDMLTELNAALVARRGHGSAEANHLYRRARVLCDRLGQPLDPPLLRGMALGALVRRDFDEAYALGEELLRRGRSATNSTITVEGHYVLGVTAFFRGEFTDSAEQLRGALAEYRESGRQEHLRLFAQDPQAVCLSRLALTQLYLGQPDIALRTCDEAVSCARQLAHPWTLGYVLMFAALLYAELGDVARTSEFVNQARPVTGEQEGKAELDLMVHIIGGWVEVNTGDADEGIAQIRDGLDGFDRQARRALETYGLTLLARAYRLARNDAAATAIARQALELTERSGQHYLRSELLRLTGELLAPRDRDAAAALLRRAAEVARDQQSKLLELRALAALDQMKR